MARDEVKSVKVVTATHFKAHCMRLLEDVRRTRQALLVTSHGKPLAEIRPVSAVSARINPLRVSVVQQNDLVTPIAETWDCCN